MSDVPATKKRKESYHDDKTSFENPLVTRYASDMMNFVWSPHFKFTQWRKLWLSLAKGQKLLGLSITDEQLEEMETHLTYIDYELAAEKEKELRHDVMAHIHAWGEQCPKARPIIHLGATSCFVGDNTDLIQIRRSLVIVKTRLYGFIKDFQDVVLDYRAVPVLGYTHFQAAQLTTVGKRMSLWLQDFVIDFHDLVNMIETLPFRGLKGTTGTQASFLDLFDGDHEKVKKLDRFICEEARFNKCIAVSGQTYTRKIDMKVLQLLSGIAQSAHKMATDMRLWMHTKEVEEPFGKNQVGSSAMAYKRNPMLSERVCGIARFVMSLSENGTQTAANQWFERTLDDSANRRLSLPQSFLATDSILLLVRNIISGIVVNRKVIQKNIALELPFMATENILMACVQAGGDRQSLHEEIRTMSMYAGRQVKDEGKENELIDMIREHPAFKAVHPRLNELTDPNMFIGRAPEQVAEFISEEVNPILVGFVPEMIFNDKTIDV